jgi:transposase
MSLAELLITSVLVEGRTKSEVARDYKVSRYWVQQLVHRYEIEGAAAFQPRSRRPQHNPRAVAADVEDRIIRLRKELSKHGLDAGAETIRVHLQRDPAGTRIPSVSTIWRILVRRGFVTSQPKKRPKGAGTRFCADLPNERWQADITHWQLADGTDMEILNIEDDHSRLDLRSDARLSTTGQDVLTSFRRAFRQYGIPARVLTDNGAVFTGEPRHGGRVALEIELDLLGVKFDHSRPYHPQTCGKSNASTRPRRSGSPPSPRLAHSPSCKPNSTDSAATTTPCAPTGRSTAPPRPRHTRPAPRPSRPTRRSASTTTSGETASTPAASSPSATTANCATSASDANTAAHASSP